MGRFLVRKTGPRSTQDRPKTALRRIKIPIVCKVAFVIDFWSSWAPSWHPLGASWGLRVSSWGPLGALLGTQDGPKIDPSSACKIQPPILCARDGPKTAQDRQRWPKHSPKWHQESPKTTKNGQPRPPRGAKTIEEQSTKRPKTTNTTPHNTVQCR